MRQIDYYVRQLKQIYEGDNWLDENFRKKLSTLDEASAFTQPVRGVHSVAEILWHVIYWRNVNLQRLVGNPGYRHATIDEQNFLKPETLRGMGWQRLLDDLKASQVNLITLLSQQDDSFLVNEYEPGLTFDFVIAGTIEHDAYHLGQIGLVLKIIGTQQENMH